MLSVSYGEFSDIYECRFYVRLLDHSILLRARHCELIPLHNHELILSLMAIVRSWLKNKRGTFFSTTRIWTMVSWNQKPVSYQWTTLTPSAVKHLILFEIVLLSCFFLVLLRIEYRDVNIFPFNLLYWHSAIWFIEFFETTKNEEMFSYWFSPTKSTCLFVCFLDSNQ